MHVSTINMMPGCGQWDENKIKQIKMNVMSTDV